MAPTLDFELSTAQWVLLRRIGILQDFDLVAPIARYKQMDYARLGMELINAFGTFSNAIEKTLTYCKTQRGMQSRQYQLLLSAALVTEGEHLPGLLKSFALERKASQKDYPYSTIRYGLHEVMETFTYDRDEANAAFNNQFYAPRYPRLFDSHGNARFNVDDHLAVFEEVMAIHAYHCLADLMDLPDYRRLMAVFEAKLPSRYHRLCSEHRETLIMRQVSVDDARRLVHFPLVPDVVEMDSRVVAMISHIMMTGNRDAEVNTCGDDLEARLAGVDRFGAALLALPLDQHQALMDAIGKRISLYLRPSHPGTFQWLSEGFFDLEDRMLPIREMFSRFEVAGLSLDDLMLTCMRKEGISEFPVQHNGAFSHHERALCIAYIHQNDEYEENWFREPLVQIIAERIDVAQVLWDELTLEQASRLYHLAPNSAVMRHTSSQEIRDLVFQGELGL